MKKNILVASLLVIIVFLCAVIVHVENERYAMFIGLCYDENRKMADPKCLEKVKTRTGWQYHLINAVADIF